MLFALVLSLVLTVGFKLWAITLYPITCDESYYWLWQKHPALSYVDHPPMIAWLHHGISLFGDHNLFHIRVTAILLALICTYIIYLLGKTLFNQKVGLIAATLFSLVPHYLIIWQTLTIDNPMSLFWILSLFLVAKIITTKNPRYWYFLGISIGLGLLSKYTTIFFLPMLVLFFIIDKNQRHWFKSIHPYLGVGGLSAIVFSPVIIWNNQHQWASFAFHSGRLHAQMPWQNLLIFTGDQLVHFSPFLLIGLIIGSISLWKKSKFLFTFSIPLLLLFIGFTGFIRVWAHWVIVFHFAAVVGIAALLETKPKLTKATIISMIVFDLFIAFAILSGVKTLLPRQADYQHNLTLRAAYQSVPLTTPLITPYLGIASQLTFYTGRFAYMAQKELRIEQHGFGQRQFNLWGFPTLHTGDNIIYFGPNNAQTEAKLKTLFVSVKKREDLDVNLIETWLDELIPYQCDGLKDGRVNL